LRRNSSRCIETWRRRFRGGANVTSEGGETPRRPTNARILLIAGYSLAGIVQLAVAALSTRITQVPLSAQFGILQMLPPTYWLGMGLIGFATVLSLRERSEVLTVMTGVLFLAALAGTPSLFEPNPRYWDSYVHLSDAQSIQSTGHLTAANLAQYSANWPGSFLLDSIVMDVGGIPAMTLLRIYPFLSGGITFLAIFVFLRSTFPRPVAGPSAILTSLFAVWAQFHLSPQSLGFVLMLLVLSVIWRRETRWRLMSVILFVGLVTSHPTSTLLLLSVLIVFSFASLFGMRKSPEVRRDARFARRVTATYGLAWFAWLYFRATASSQAAETAIVFRIGRLLSLPESTLNIATARAVENLFTYAPLLRLGSLAIYGLLGFVSLLVLVRQQASRPLARFLFAGLIGPAIIGGADIVGFGGQFYDRSLLFFSTLAPALCLTGLRGLRIRLPKLARHAIVAVLVAASVAAASTVYYQESFNNVTDQAIATSQFLNRAPPKSVIIDGAYPEPVWIPPPDRPSRGVYTFLQAYPTPLQNMSGPPTYAVFDPIARLWYRQWRGINIYRFYEAERASLPVIYDNGQSTIYRVGG
jgi:hypothetical protein